jgi:hypothetical protein
VSSTKVLTFAETLIREIGAIAPREFSIGCGYLVKNGERLSRFVDARLGWMANELGNKNADTKLCRRFEGRNGVLFVQSAQNRNPSHKCFSARHHSARVVPA